MAGPLPGCGTLDGWMGMDVCGDDSKMVVETVVQERFVLGMVVSILQKTCDFVNGPNQTHISRIL